MTIPMMPEGPHTSDPDTFDDRADAWIAATNPMLKQMNIDIELTNRNVLAAAASAATASEKERAASLSAVDAAAAAATALSKASNAAASAIAAQESALVAQGAQISSTSVTPLVIGTGDKTFVTQAGKQYKVGVPIIAVFPTDPSKYMAGTIAEYVGTSLRIKVNGVGGLGSEVNNWNISLAGIKGDPGTTASNTSFPVIPVELFDCDLSLGNYFTKDANGNSTFTFSKVPSQGFSFTLRLRYVNGIVAFPASVVAQTKQIPILVSGRVYLFIFVTDDGGATWFMGIHQNYGS